jgi:hypothetical protein
MVRFEGLLNGNDEYFQLVIRVRFVCHVFFNYLYNNLGDT